MTDPKQLPVRQYAVQLAESVRDYPVTVVIGETGSGKTTQISQILEEAGFAAQGAIAITQPRRVAAVTVARRVAFERGCELGNEVGYAVRFEDRTSRRTRIKYLTDGTLLREVLEDPSLSRYSVVVLDEAHERSLNTDILFGLLKALALGKGRSRNRSREGRGGSRRQSSGSRVDARGQDGSGRALHDAEAAPGSAALASSVPEQQQQQQQLGGGGAAEEARVEEGREGGGEDQLLPPLRLVVTSATLETEKFSAYFNDCPVFRVPGRTFPVEITHSLEDHTADYQAAAVDTAIDIHCNQPEGDILLFLSGQAEIDKAVRALNEGVRALPPGACADLLARVFAPPTSGVRRCIVATNIAETSVTVDGVVFVIDPGVVKQKDYNPRTGMDSLQVVPISRVQATQRTGRAGRTRPGRCFRLYTKKAFEREMPNATPPEIQRTSLTAAVLYLKSLPLDIDVLGFDYIDAPQRDALEDALRQLYVLDAIDADGGITPTGRAMSALPLDPSLARALLAARHLGCLPSMLSVAGMVSIEGGVFVGGKGPEQLVNVAAGGQQRDGRDQRGRPAHHPALSPQGRALLEGMMGDGLGDHVLRLRLYEAWQGAGCSVEWCREVGVDQRSMRFARDVRQQLERITRPDGSGLGGEGGDADAGRERRERSGSRREQVAGRALTLAGREGAEGQRRGGKRQRSSEPGSTDATAMLRALRHALAIGFANRLARRLPMHNGYRTLGTTPALAQVHPSCARLAADDDGLLPEWLVYHELVSTGRVYLSGVCPVEEGWVAELVPKLQGVDVARLSGGATGERAKQEAAGGASVAAAAALAAAPAERRNTDVAVDAARARFLARKAAAAAAGGKKR